MRKRIYKIWYGMKSRCNKPGDKDYKLYGGRGIKMCQEWLVFENFYQWAITNGYKDNLSIDRIDCNGNYEPSNCRWVTQNVQVRNRRLLRNNTTGYTGIYIDRGLYRATIYVNNKRIDLGRHKTLEEAIQVRKQAELTKWGQ